MGKKSLVLIAVIVFILAACGEEESNASLSLSWISLAKQYNIPGLISLDYDKTDKVFVLGYYVDGGTGRYEIRDESFTILKEKKLSSTPYSILYAKDSVYASRDVHYFGTDNGMVMEFEDGGKATLYDPKLKKKTLLYQDSRAPSWISFNSMTETDEYYVLSIYSATTCILIDKKTFEVKTFTDSFKKFTAEGGRSVVKTKKGEIILSIHLSGKVVDDYLTFRNGAWEKFRPTTLNSAGDIKFIDSRNYIWLDHGYGESYLRLYDLENDRFIETKPAVLSGNYFGYSIHEVSKGDIILLSGTLSSTSYELMQIQLSK